MAKRKRTTHREPENSMRDEFERIRLELEAETIEENLLTEAPPPPTCLDEVGAAYWRKLAGLLVARRTLKTSHLEALQSLCQSWSAYTMFRAHLGRDLEKWIVANARTGSRKQSPEVGLMRAALAELQVGWARFGLTPHGESRVIPERVAAKNGRSPSDTAATYLQRVAELKTLHDEDGRLF
jgi:P27 family predicted phage terminase small subunit